MKTMTTTVIAATLLVLGGCARNSSQVEADPGYEVLPSPEWVSSPKVDDGLAATGCVPASNNRALDSNRADNQARQQLASNFSIMVEAMGIEYGRIVNTTEEGHEPRAGGVFEQVSRQLTSAELVGSYRVRGDYIDQGRGLEYCSKMAIRASTLGDILALNADAVGAEPELFTQGESRELFMSERALEEMDDALRNYRPSGNTGE